MQNGKDGSYLLRPSTSRPGHLVISLRYAPPARASVILLSTPTLHCYCSHLTAYVSTTSWVSRYQRGKTSRDLNEARDDSVLGCSDISWTTCKQSAPRSRQITTPTPHHSIFTGWMLFLTPNQQCQSTQGSLILLWKTVICHYLHCNGCCLDWEFVAYHFTVRKNSWILPVFTIHKDNSYLHTSIKHQAINVPCLHFVLERWNRHFVTYMLAYRY